MSNPTPIPFDYDEFLLEYPEFVGYSTETNITNIWNRSAAVIGQNASALFSESEEQYYWISVMLAHILTCRMLNLPGRPASVGQGSENITFDLTAPAWAQWLAKTAYGQEIMAVMQEYLNGGHYISNGECPYLGNSMNGANELGFTWW